MNVYHVFVIAIGAAFLLASIKRCSTPKNKNKFDELMYTEQEREND